MIKILTIEREYGCGAGAISRKLAERLGWKLWDQEITSAIAKRLKCNVAAVAEREERLDPTFYRLMKVFMRGSYEESMAGSGMDVLDADFLARSFEKLITEIAAQGNCIIVGRASHWFLRNHADALHIFLYAPYEEKMRRLTDDGKSAPEAEELIERVDRERAAFIKKYHNMMWPTRHLFHMMLNSKVGDEIVIRLVLEEMTLLNVSPSTTRAR